MHRVVVPLKLAPGAEMPAYVFRKIGASGHVYDGPGHAQLTDDFAAVEAARRLIDGCDIEVWCGDRLVAYVVADDAPDYRGTSAPS